jgi:4-amino-4-deoxy-L-arabinose transferase-like glycosyltransferase
MQSSVPRALVPSQSISASAQDYLRLASLLGIHALVWTLGSWLYRANLDWAGDMLENYSWGVEWQAGYHKHPPLFAWMTAAWFRVFPRTDIAYFALSNVNALIGLCGIVALARRFLPARLAVLAGLAMAVSPMYTTLAIKFNANTVLLSVWPWTAYCFVRYMQTGTRKAALALGAVAMLAMLGKYFSVVLLGGLAVAAYVRPAWRARLLAPESALAVMAALLVLMPHLHWLIQSDMQPFRYAAHRMTEIERGFPRAVFDMAGYVLTQIVYMLPSLALVLWTLRHHRASAARLLLGGYLRPSLHRDLWWLSMATLLVIVCVALVTSTKLSALWGNTQWFALVPFWLAVLDQAGSSVDIRRAGRLMVVYWVLVLVLSAVGGYMKAARHDPLAMEPRAELAAAARAVWQAHTNRPLAVVSGEVKAARSIAFYGTGLTHYWDLWEPDTTPWLSAQDVRRLGALLVCPARDSRCQEDAASFTGSAAIPVEVNRTVWGITFPPRPYVLFVMLPKAD